MERAMELTTAARELHQLRADLAAHISAAEAEEKRLRAEIGKRETVLKMSAAEIDETKVALARTVIYATDYEQGGNDRAGCVHDAIRQLATGEPVRTRTYYGDLWRVYFGTKNYDRWRGQREDHEYGYGPKHGSTCFRIGVTDEARQRGQADLTPEEIEAAIYFLVNLERIQRAEKSAQAAAAE